MAHGLQIFDSHGHLAFSTVDLTWMQIDQFTVGANQTVVNNYPVATGMTLITQVQMLNSPPDAQEDYAPNITIAGTTVTVAPQSGLTSQPVVVMVLAQD